MSDLRNVRVVVLGALVFSGCNGGIDALWQRLTQPIPIDDMGGGGPPETDLAMPWDMGGPPDTDLATPWDMSDMSDLATPWDMSDMSDLATPWDMSDMADLGPDMTPPPGHCECSVEMDGVAPPDVNETDAPVCGLGMCGLQQNEAGAIDCGGCPDPYDSCSSNQDGTYDGYCYKTYQAAEDPQWLSCGGPNQVACQVYDPTYGMTYFCKSDVLYPYIPQGQSIVLCDIAAIAGGP